MSLSQDQFDGCMLGLATGDALGAPHEGGPLERLVWRLIGRTSDGCLRWTDDTQMSLDLAESLLDEGGVNPEALAKRFAASYRWSRGYGAGAAKVLKRIRRGEAWETAAKAAYVEGSFGNGAAMRAPIVALYFPYDRKTLLDAAKSSAVVTHAHPLGIEGAILVAIAAQVLLRRRSPIEVLEAIRCECRSPEMSVRLQTIASWMESKATPGPREVASKLGNGITAPTSCPTAIYIALSHRDASFEDMMQFVIACRGDVDTIGAMAGALWGIVNGAERLPQVRLEARDRILSVARRMFQNSTGPGAASNRDGA